MVSHTIADSLRNAGFRATAGKIAILTVLSGMSEPLSVSGILKKLKGKVDTVTVYRAVEDLSRAGLVRRVDLGHQHAHYEVVDSKGRHHHHLVCRMCGAVEDVEQCDPAHLEGAVLRKSKRFASIETHTMEFFGICRECIKT
jgi:Fur family ferric uptake transcriptional regulator